MPPQRRERLRRVVSGLLVMMILVLSVTRANAVAQPGWNIVLQVAGSVASGSRGESEGVARVHDHSGSPCQGHVHGEGLTCCPALCCLFGAGNIPSVAAIPAPVPAVLPGYPMPPTALPRGHSSAPTLPPPRQGVG
jgi:hypothetical protein